MLYKDDFSIFAENNIILNEVINPYIKSKT